VPIEIKELHIRVSVSPPDGGRPAGAASPATPVDAAALPPAVVAEIVEQVLQTLREQKER
jgi:hypothetical protein